MDWADYLRDQAAKYRQLAETAENLSVKEEPLDLAAICEETANNIEDRMAGVTSKVSSRSGRTFPIVPAARPIGFKMKNPARSAVKRDVEDWGR